MHNRVDGNVVIFVWFAHHLVVHLGTRRHIDDDILFEQSLTTESPTLSQAAPDAVTLLSLAERRHIAGPGRDAMFGKLAFSDLDLATPTNCTPAAYRVNIDAETACGIQDRCRERETTSLSRGYKDNHRIFIILIAHTTPDSISRCRNAAGG